MKHAFWNKLLLVTLVLLLGACVTERKRGIFKEPTSEDLQRAVDFHLQSVYLAIDIQDYEQAMKSAKAALEDDPDSAKVITALANVYRAQGDKDKADETYRKAIREDSKFTRAHVDYGKFLYEQKKYKEAADQFKKASEDDFYENRAFIYHNLAVCLNAQNKTQEAIAAFDRATSLDPKFAEPHLELAQYFYDNKQFPEAKKHLDTYMALNRESQNPPGARALWLGIRIVRYFDDKDAEASYAVFLKNTYPFSQEYLEYKNSLAQ